MRWFAGILPLLLAASTTAASELVPSTDADAKFQAIERSIYLYDAQPYTIAKAVEKNEVAGLSVVLIHDGKPAVHRTYGYQVKRKEERTTEATIYQCASTSKMVSSLGVLAAARRGELKLDQPITDFNAGYGDSLLRRWVAQYFTGDEAAWPREITLRRLLSHTAGLAVHGISAAPWLPSNDPLESILFGRSAFKDAVEPIHEPGTVWDYSGGGYTVAEAWLQIATGAKFQDYLKAHVLDPLGMTRSTFETGSPDTANLAWGCSRGVCLYNVRTLDVKAAGGLLCHPVDYARLVALILNGGKEYMAAGRGTQLIPADDVAALLTPALHKDTGKRLGGGYGLGAFLSEYTSADGLPTRFDHGGAHQGFSIEFYGRRDMRAGIVVLVNGDREWSKQREEYGGGTLSKAVVEAFKLAYGIGGGKPLTARCGKDVDCATGEYCDAGVDLDKNECVPKKDDHEACNLVGGGHQCKGGRCAYGRCYTLDSVPMGGACYVDAACDMGKCSAMNGARGSCVCNSDTDCGPGRWCNAGLDLAGNSCQALKADNEACDVVGGGHQCRGGKCGLGRCYTEAAVAMGGTCYMDAACSAGKCSAFDGTRGTCVCQGDGDCGAGRYCDAGLDAKLNACRAKLDKGETCGKALSVGNDHKCKSGKCSGAPFYKCT